MKPFSKQWDKVRRRKVAATPEEAVRQALISYLLQRGYPLSAIQVEYSVGKGRFDLAVSAPDGSLWLLAECKAGQPPTAVETLWRQAYAQLRRYQQVLPPVHHLAVAIGQQLWCWQVEPFALLPELPPYPHA